MPEQDVTKKCCKCKKNLHVNQYSKDKTRKDKYAPRCKNCHAIANRMSKINNPKRRQHLREYMRKWRQTENGYKARLRMKRKSQKTYPEKYSAQNAVYQARKKGVLSSPAKYTCQKCQEQQAEQYHHWSYLKQYRLDVTPVCVKCHNIIHGRVA